MWSDRCDAYRAALNDGPYLAGDRPTFASHWSASYQSTLASHRPAFASNRWTFASPTGRRSLREVLIVSSGCQVDRPDGHPYRPEIDQNANDLAFGHSSFSSFGTVAVRMAFGSWQVKNSFGGNLSSSFSERPFES